VASCPPAVPTLAPPPRLCILDCDICPRIQGSDHCPVYVTLGFPVDEEAAPDHEVVPYPHAWSVNAHPRYAKKQTKIEVFLARAAAAAALKQQQQQERTVQQAETIANARTAAGSDASRSSSSSGIGAMKRPREEAGGAKAAVPPPSKQWSKPSLSSKQQMRLELFAKPSAAASSAQDSPVIVVLSDSDSDGAPACMLDASDRVAEDTSVPSNIHADAPTTSVPAPASAAPGAAASSSAGWSSVLMGEIPPPVCHCGDATVERTVIQKGSANVGRRFFVCRNPEGARCDFFQWLTAHRKQAARSRELAGPAMR
jgi:hypothetical protein